MEKSKIFSDKEATDKDLEVEGVKISELYTNDTDDEDEDVDYDEEEEINEAVEDSEGDSEEMEPIFLSTEKPGFESGATVCLTFLYKVTLFFY